MAIESCKHLYIKSSDTRFLSGEVRIDRKIKKVIFIKANTIYEVSLEDASIYKIEILKSDISIYIQLYNAKRVKIIFLNYYGIIDYHAIGQEIGDFEIQHDSDFIQQIISEEIESGASRAYMDGLTFTHFRLFETWKRKKILEIVCEKIEVEYL